MNIIVNVAKDWGIGCGNQLLFNIPADMKYFKEKTTGGVVVMGENTYHSLPKRPLPNRVNIVLSLDPDFTAEGVSICHSLAEFFAESKKYADDQIFVIGGQAIYNLLLPYCRYAYITRVEAIAKADSFFPDTDILPNWHITEQSPEYCHEGLNYSFLTYENENPLI
jgi:dihydrofolate reductase